MKEIILRPKASIELPVEAEVIKPDEFAGKSLAEIRKLTVYQGRHPLPLGKFFDVRGQSFQDPSNLRIVIEGDVSRVKRVGEGMSAGEILIKGSAGMYLGAQMSGGKLIVEGDVDAWAGQQMSGGEILIGGNSGDYLGASYRGDWRGMRGGKIIVKGNAGREIGEWMRSGMIEAKGNVGLYTGIHMHGGIIIVRGEVEGRLGAQMVGGDIVVTGKVAKLLPGFKFELEVENPKFNDLIIEGKFLKFTGDVAEGGKGRLFLASEINQHLIQR